MKYKTPTPSRTLTRARLDAAVYALYLKLHNGKPSAIAAKKFISGYSISPSILADMKALGIITSISWGRGAKHAWTGAPPTHDLIDRLEQLREARNSRQQERAAAKRVAARSLQEAREILKHKAPTAAPDAETPSDGWSRIEYALSLTDNVDLLLDFRNRVDRRLRQVRPTPPTLFDSQL